MKVLILGATGGTGQHALKHALAQGHDVTILVRRPETVPADARGVRVAVGDVRDSGAVAGAVRGQDAVVSALGVGRSFKPEGLIAAATPVILKAMADAGVKRLVFTSAYGVGDTWQDVPTIPRVVMKILLRGVYADKLAGDQAVRASALDWTLVHPTTLTDKPGSGKYRVGERLTLSGLPTVSRADVGAFLVSQVSDLTYSRRSVLITAS